MVNSIWGICLPIPRKNKVQFHKNKQFFRIVLLLYIATFPCVRIPSVSVFRPYSLFDHFHVQEFIPYNPDISTGTNSADNTKNDNRKNFNFRTSKVKVI